MCKGYLSLPHSYTGALRGWRPGDDTLLCDRRAYLATIVGDRQLYCVCPGCCVLMYRDGRVWCWIYVMKGFVSAVAVVKGLLSNKKAWSCCGVTWIKYGIQDPVRHAGEPSCRHRMLLGLGGRRS